MSSAMWRHVVWYNITRVLEKSYSRDLQGRISCALRMEAIGSSEKLVNFYQTASRPWIVFCIVPAVRSFSAIHKISSILCDMKVLHHVHHSLPLVPVLNQSIQSIPHSLNIHLILSWHLCRSPLCILIPSGFQSKTLYAPRISPKHSTYRMS